MITPAQIMAEGRTWVDVPTFDKGRTRAGGVDCLGLILAVGLDTGAISGPIDVPVYGKLPNPRTLIASMDAAMIRIEAQAAGDGDVISLAWGRAGHPMHLAILATYRGRRSMIHADPLAGRVTEITFGGMWASRAKGCPAWRFPRLDVSHS